MERQSCDRCHDYKVRCTKTTDGGPCLRCQRAGVKCVQASAPRSRMQGIDSPNGSSQRRVRSQPRSHTQTPVQAYSGSGVEQAKPPWLATGLLTPGEADIVSGQGYDWACSLGPQQVTATGEKQIDSCQFGFASHSAAASALLESGLVHHAETADGSTPMFVPFAASQGYNSTVNNPEAFHHTHTSGQRPLNYRQMNHHRHRPGAEDAIENAEECMGRLFQLHLDLYRTRTGPVEASQMIQFSQSFLFIIHSLYRNSMDSSGIQSSDRDNPSSQPSTTFSTHTTQVLDDAGATAIPVISCYNQFLSLYLEFIRGLQHPPFSCFVSSSLNTGIGTSLLLPPPSTAEIEDSIKKQLALHLLNRVRQSTRTYITLRLEQRGGFTKPGSFRLGEEQARCGFTQATEPFVVFLSTLNEQETQLDQALGRISE